MKYSKTILQIQKDLEAREEKGISTYGTTVDQAELTQQEWLQHLYEELLDAVIYLHKLKTGMVEDIKPITEEVSPLQSMRFDILDFGEELKEGGHL